MDTDGFDPWDEHPESITAAKEKRARDIRDIYDRGLINDGVFKQNYQQQWIPSTMGGGGGGAGYASGGNSIWPAQHVQYFVAGGGGGGNVFTEVNRKQLSQEEKQEMAWTNPEARDIAREIIHEEKREGLREKITEVVANYRKMLEGAHCGSVFSFMKLNDEGKHYWYAAIKNGGKWYTTAHDPRVLEDDDALITWLVALEAYESEASELTVGAAHTALALGPIDSTATE